MRALRVRLLMACAALAASLSLGGCVTPGPTPRLHILTPAVVTRLPTPAAATSRGVKPLVVVIKDVRLPLYLDRPQIVTRDDGNRLELSEFEQWGGHLREDMARVLAMNLGQILDGDRVLAAPYRLATPPDYRVEVDIQAFERQPGGRVGLSAQWWLSRGADATLLAGSGATFSGEVLAQGVSYQSLVGAMSAVYGELAQAIARSIRQQQAGGS